MVSSTYLGYILTFIANVMTANLLFGISILQLLIIISVFSLVIKIILRR